MHMNAVTAFAILGALASAAPNKRTSPTDDFCPTGTCWHNGIGTDGVFACEPCDTNGKRDPVLSEEIAKRALNCNEPECWVPGPSDDILNGSCVPCNANGGGIKRAPKPDAVEAPAAKRTSPTDDFCPTGTCWHNGIGTDGVFACVPCDSNGKREETVAKRTSPTDDFCPTGTCWHNGIGTDGVFACEPCDTNGKRDPVLSEEIAKRALNCNEPECWVPGPADDILNGQCVPCNTNGGGIKREPNPVEAPAAKRTSATDDFCPTGSCWHNGIQDGIIGYCEPCSTNGKRSEMLAPFIKARALNCNDPLCWVPGPTNDILNGQCVPCNTNGGGI